MLEDCGFTVTGHNKNQIHINGLPVYYILHPKGGVTLKDLQEADNARYYAQMMSLHTKKRKDKFVNDVQRILLHVGWRLSGRKAHHLEPTLREQYEQQLRDLRRDGILNQYQVSKSYINIELPFGSFMLSKRAAITKISPRTPRQNSTLDYLKGYHNALGEFIEEAKEISNRLKNGKNKDKKGSEEATEATT